jgi:hypothetical protein
MDAVFKKLNFTNQPLCCVVNAPESFQKNMADMAPLTVINTSLKGVEALPFFLAFVTKQREVDALARSLPRLMAPDGTVWLAYPKGSSKKYTCEFNRDNGWTEWGRQGYEPVRQVAIDDDWSALRFRKVEHIKKMTRSFAMTEAGKKKVAAAKKKAAKNSR